MPRSGTPAALVAAALAFALQAGVAAAPPAAAAAASPAASAASGASSEWPLYRASPAPPARLHGRMSRGMLSGTGDLVWRPVGDRYELRLEASVAGMAVLTEVSSGRLGAEGLAPTRYTDQRLRRSRVADFRADQGRIAYGDGSPAVPMPAGAQDRLSWMLQLGAVLNAQPQLAGPGGKVTFFVTGARGDADTWVFRYAGTEPVGAQAAVKFTREPRQPEDRLVEIWLSPARHHLPVRARFSTQANGEIFELLLRDMTAP